MEFLSDLLVLLDTQMPVPELYGDFHIFFIAVSLLAGFWICRLCKGADEASIRRFLLIQSLLAIGLEVYKQINYSFSVQDGRIVFDYQWYAFPFQFCSTPMYIGLLAAVVRKEAVHRRLCAYLACYSLFAGICVMLYPASVFVGTAGINIQTMICHGLMVCVGMVLLGTGYVRPSRKTLGRALPVFLVLVFCAAVMNEGAHQAGLLETETFNMFFISPYCAPELPVYSLVQGLVPYRVSLLIYVGGFTAASGLVLLFAGALRRAAAAVHEHRKPGKQLHSHSMLF